MISMCELRKRLWYSRKTGVWRWRKNHGGKMSGNTAGSLHSSGYVHIKIDGRIYKAHRLAWLYVNGIDPILDVEHRNRIKSDNRWNNLRLANDSLNQANVGRRIDNTSGFKSVRYRKDSKKWRSTIQVNGRRFSLGSFNTPQAAHAAYCIAANKHFGEFAHA